MNHVRYPLALTITLAACGATPTPAPPARATPPVPAIAATTRSPDRADDAASAIARVEHGLVPELRVDGERGWSIDERLRAHHVPGVSVAVVHDHRVAWARAYGVADASTGAPLTPTTLLEAASISKMVTAIAALRLVESGELALDADVNRSLRSWHLPDNEFTRATPVTLKHLLGHTGGTTVSGFLGFAAGEPVPTLREVLDGAPPATSPPVRVDRAPGTGFRYSGGGTSIVQQLVVDARGPDFPGSMRALVLGPLSMESSTFEQTLPSGIAARAAAGHDYDAKVIPGGRQTYPQMAAAGLRTTPTDLARCLIEIQLARAGQSRILSRDLAVRMTSAAAPGPDTDVDVGLGTFVERHGGIVYFGHDGLNDGFVAMLRGSQTKGEGAVVMANGFGAGSLVQEILRSVAVEYGWEGWVAPPIARVKVDAARIASLAGSYGLADAPTTTIRAAGDRLEVIRPFQEPVELVPIAGDVFVNRDDGARYAFQKSATGGDEVVRTPRTGGGATWPRIARPKVDPMALVEAGRESEALVAYRRVLAANPKDRVADEAVFDSAGGELLDRRLDPERAASVFRVDVALHPKSVHGFARLAEALLRTGRRAEAVAACERAKSLFHASAGALPEHDALWLRFRLTRLKRMGL